MRFERTHIALALGTGRVLTAALMLAIFVVMVVIAFGFPPDARIMPLIAGVPGTLLAAICFAQELRKVAREPAATTATPAPRNAEHMMLVWLMVFFGAILAFGFTYSVPVLVFAYLKFGARERFAIALIGALAIWAVLYGLFEQGFGIPLFEGLLRAWLLG